jgi:hypothetical protein
MKRNKTSCEYKIEENIPFPTVFSLRHSKYPFEQMKVGDSFFVPGINSTQFSYALRAPNKGAENKRFASRTVEGGVRVWRIQ